MNTLKKKSLGRTAILGQLYDVRSDSFLNTNIFKDQIPEENIQTANVSDLSYENFASSSSQEKFNSLGVDGNLKLSILCGLIDITGSASYLKEDNNEKKVVRGSLIYKIETSLDSIDIKTNSLKSPIDIDSLNNSEATHIVTKIKYGANVIVTFEKTFKDESNKKEISGSLSDIMKNIGGCFSMDGDFSLKENDRKLLGEFKIKFFGEIIPKNEEIPNSVEAALNIMKKIPKYLETVNKGKGIPVEYMLLPIETVQRQLSIENELKRVYKNIGEDLIKQIEVEFEQLAAHQLELKGFYAELLEMKDFFNINQLSPVSDFINKVSVNEKTFKKSISELIVAVRGCTKDISSLEECVSSYISSEYSSNGIKKFLELSHQANLKNQLSFIQEIKALNIDIVSKTMNKSQVIKKSKNNCKLYILNYYNSTRTMSQTWDPIYISTFITKYNEKRKKTKFAIIDLEMHNIVPNQENSSNDSTSKVPFVEIYVNQKLKQSNFIIYPFSNFSERFEETGFNFNGKAPMDIPFLRLKCPGKDCPKVPKEFICLVCNQYLKYSTKTLYCQCGSYPVTSCTFKCCEPEHGNDYVKLPNSEEDQLKYLPPRPLTLLLLGETGVGKSTFINSLVNYALYHSLEDAIKGEIKVLIPIKFSMVTNGVQKEISIGNKTKNENLSVGQSSTQSCQTYIFLDLNLTIIDTPGIGDVRGVDQDKANFEHILSYISRFDTIDGICILLKPNEARETVVSTYCFKGLLSQLNKNAAKNIVFCYTNSRSTFYQPGDSHPKISKMVQSLNVPDLKYTSSNTFCFDSESFRFLAALKNDVQFGEDQIKDFSNSWKTSVTSTNNLISYLNLLPPHNIRNTTSLNESRRLIYALTRPIVEITQMIETKVKTITTKKKEIEDDNSDLESLKKKLIIKYDDVERRDLDEPTTVCTNSTCIKVITGKDGNEIVHYAQRCHVGCQIKGPTNTKNSADLKNCCAIGKSDLKCTECQFSCHYTSHMHITYETYPVTKTLENAAIKDQINIATDSCQLKKEAIIELEKEIEANNKEKTEIINISSKLSFFLKENSITGYVDTVIEYLKMCIQTEDYKTDKTNKKSLEKNLLIFEEQNRILQAAVSNCNELITVDQVPILIEKLKNLPINGPTLKLHIEGNESAQMTSNYKPIVIKPIENLYNKFKSYFYFK
ncbi:hypothetical protein DICPUDRAFT_25410 [Dictyostelium purpureum]|uniref:Uncharacterized protein n=1 Tax=Dictyostelium purpureum TaxID=5786 RepID=F0Z6Z8_DICPU|nr:uncharacterized protein DICPUDRAFT_25410 [Dictyostelium purpureum]EGC40243.1 hypothetical protein DICPUDRAFT_25410 [Dictyostelium purpureum]|eukprot:XP_003283179.1 hypothetical protein DICPUDRAFT_25410 [Dictyostelium purpureum]